MTSIIEASSVSVIIGRKRLLDDVSLAISPGELVALVGTNGAGKSTLLRALSGELAASHGIIRLRGHDLRSYRPRELSLHRAVLSQALSVTFPFSVADVVRMGAGERHDASVEALIDHALAQVDLQGFQTRNVNTLSGGEQQRVHFARVLVQASCGEAIHGPGLMLLDEPIASLDLRHQLDLVTAVKSHAARGTTVVAILHDLNIAALFADRIVVLHNGRVAADGPPSRTITDDLLRATFGISNAVSRIPDGGRPYVLPHHARKV
jgi:iron complex transport system ATP-binding protein